MSLTRVPGILWRVGHTACPLKWQTAGTSCSSRNGRFPKATGRNPNRSLACVSDATPIFLSRACYRTSCQRPSLDGKVERYVGT